MTNKERHIAVLNRMLESMDVYDSIQPTTERKKAIKAAIKALEQEPCDDAIIRQAAIDIIESWLSCDDYNETERHIMRAMQSVLYDLPSVTQKSGKWIEHPEIETSAPEYLMFYECSECGDKQCFCKSDIHKKRFCNNCGAKMERGEKE